MDNSYEKLLDKLSKADNVAVLTGAGISAESGIKTFRDPDGLWAKFNPAELASIDGFMSNPELVWSWYQERVEIVNNAEPNPGHKALAEFEKLYDDFTIITQNVDGLHQAGGAENVVELHGSIVKNKCFDCGMPFNGKVALPDKKVPKCEDCDGLIRPDVVWFGEMLPQNAIKKADIASMKAEVFFSIGTSAEVTPAANFPVQAKEYGAFLVEVNPNDTVLSSYVDHKIAEPSGEGLPKLLEDLKEYKEK